MILKKWFLWESNLEFTLLPQEQRVSSKVLYRSHWNPQNFKKKIYTYLQECVTDLNIRFKIDKIFTINEVKELTFHFWEDSLKNKQKFYISLYGVDFKKSLIIISKIKKILGIKEYTLEKNFSAFDCLWFDINQEGIHLKVYELYATHKDYLWFLPSFIPLWEVKEIGVLKTQKRRKIFFRFKKPLELDYSFFSKEEFMKTEKYNIHWKMTYYCVEKWKEEIYFI